MARSLARIGASDLLRLAALAAEAEAGLFARHPEGAGRYAGRQQVRRAGQAGLGAGSLLADRPCAPGCRAPGLTRGPSAAEIGEWMGLLAAGIVGCGKPRSLMGSLPGGAKVPGVPGAWDCPRRDLPGRVYHVIYLSASRRACRAGMLRR
jgi:hypothetical protein